MKGFDEGLIVVAVAVTTILLIVFTIGMGKQEKVECLQWQAQAKEFPGYWITNWQKNQCDDRGITIDAPVR